jgi:hypothetical protein
MFTINLLLFIFEMNRAHESPGKYLNPPALCGSLRPESLTSLTIPGALARSPLSPVPPGIQIAEAFMRGISESVVYQDFYTLAFPRRAFQPKSSGRPLQAHSTFCLQLFHEADGKDSKQITAFCPGQAVKPAFRNVV